MIRWLSTMVNGVGGEPEIGRVSLAVGVVATVVTPIIFESLDLWHNGFHFDAAVWCVAYPGGIVALIAGGALTLGRKDRDVARAIQTRDQTSAPVDTPPN